MAWQDTSGTWHTSGVLPGQSPGFSLFSVADGNYGDLNIVGLGKNNGYLYIPDWQDWNSGTWYAAGVLPGQTRAFSDFVVAQGNSGNLQVFGLGKSDSVVYPSAWQNSSGAWSTYGTMPLYNVAVTGLIAGGAGSGLYILGLGTNNHIELITWQNNSGAWFQGEDLTVAASSGGGGGGGVRCPSGQICP